MFDEKVLLITGGTGTFGTAITRRLLDSNIKEIRIFSRDEKKQDDMRNSYNSNKLKFFLGDVRNIKSLNDCMIGVDYVFHAAALKQVPSCEFFPIEAINTNVHGAENVIDSAIENTVKKVIVLSTDKSVYPINVMGLTKSLMEKIMISKSRVAEQRGTILAGTRYGNVMCSRGSVIPRFIELIKSNKPLTITNPNMTRFMMSIDDAVDLVLYAFENINSGDIFVKKSPACEISDLALAVKEIFNSSVEIGLMGVRHGEKLHESLISKEEFIRAKEYDGYYKISADARDLNYGSYFFEGTENKLLDEYNSSNTYRLNLKEVKELLLTIPYVRSELKNG